MSVSPSLSPVWRSFSGQLLAKALLVLEENNNRYIPDENERYTKTSVVSPTKTNYLSRPGPTPEANVVKYWTYPLFPVRANLV